MGEVTILQDHHGVPDMPLTEVHPHLCPRLLLATANFDWAGHRPRTFRKLHLVGPWIVATPVCLVSLLPQPPFIHTVLGLAVRHQ